MQKPPADRDFLLPALEELAREAGAIAMRHFHAGARTSAAVSYKNGGSPVTEADFAVDRFLFEATRKLLPDSGWLSEETADDADRLGKSQLIVVDPIDGTMAYTRGDERWCVSLALVAEGRPVVGIVHAPALGSTYVAAAGRGATLNGAPIQVSSKASLAGATIVSPRGISPYLEGLALGVRLAPRIPSLALRLADIAAGGGDLAIAAPNSRDWDIAAADVILTEAGGVLGELDRAPLVYNRADSRRDMLIATSRALFSDSVALARKATAPSQRA